VTASLLEQLADLPKAEGDALIRAMTPGEANAFEYDWRYRARPQQLPPAGSWRVWLLMAGRGFGKTATGEPAIVIVVSRQYSALVPLASDEGFAGFALRGERIESCSSPSSEDLRV
jgi:hypothetical protein